MRMMVTGSRSIVGIKELLRKNITYETPPKEVILKAQANTQFVYKCLDSVLRKRVFNVLIHGGADGADTISKEWALENKIKGIFVRPNWDKYGRIAGLRRNTVMVKKCVFGTAIHDSISKGTLYTIKKLIKHNKLLGIFCYPNHSYINKNDFKKYINKFRKYILNYNELK